MAPIVVILAFLTGSVLCVRALLQLRPKHVERTLDVSPSQSSLRVFAFVLREFGVLSCGVGLVSIGLFPPYAEPPLDLGATLALVSGLVLVILPPWRPKWVSGLLATAALVGWIQVSLWGGGGRWSGHERYFHERFTALSRSDSPPVPLRTLTDFSWVRVCVFRAPLWDDEETSRRLGARFRVGEHRNLRWAEDDSNQWGLLFATPHGTVVPIRLETWVKGFSWRYDCATVDAAKIQLVRDVLSPGSTGKVIEFDD